MNDIGRINAETVLRDYIHAKDENRPHLLQAVFSVEAELRVVNKTTSIDFPALTHGREAIGEVLVRRFATIYENVYSFYMARPPAQAVQFSCDWMVGMSEKNGQDIRVGCGRYDWSFQSPPPRLASRLTITIEAMQVLPSLHFERIFTWLRRLDYPWSSPAEVEKTAPALELLAPVLEYLGGKIRGA